MKPSDVVHFDHWGTIISAVRLSGGIENENFKVVTAPFSSGVLRVYQNRSLDQVVCEVQMVQHLGGQVNCPAPVPGTNGEIIYDIDGMPAVMWQFIEGQHLDREHFTSREFQTLGGQFAALHSATRFSCFRRYFDLNETISTATGLALRLVEPPYSGLAERLHYEIESARQLIRNQPSAMSSMIHADVDQNNMIFDLNGKLWLIDWDDTSFGPCVLDSAIAFRNLVLKQFVLQGQDVGLVNQGDLAVLLKHCQDLNALPYFGDWVCFACFRYFVLMLHCALKTGAFPSANEKNFALMRLSRVLRDELNLLGENVANSQKLLAA